MRDSRLGTGRVLALIFTVSCAAAAAAAAVGAGSEPTVVTAVEGGSASLPCPAGGNDAAGLNWTWVPDHPECTGNDGDSRRFASRHDMSLAPACALKLWGLRLGDAGLFTFTRGKMSLSARLQVTPDCEAPVIVVPDRAGPATKAQNLTLHCVARGPAGEEGAPVSWFLNGNRGPHEGARQLEGGRLALPEARGRMQGVWACETRGRRAEYCLTFAHSPSSKQWGCSNRLASQQGGPDPPAAPGSTWPPWLLATVAATPTAVVVLLLLAWALLVSRRRDTQPDDIRVLHESSRQRTCEDFAFDMDSDTDAERYVTPETPKATPQATANSHGGSCARGV